MPYTSTFHPKWSVLKLQSELEAAGSKAYCLCGQLCSTVIQCGTMLWSREEESLTSGSEWAGGTQTVAEWCFFLWSLCSSVSFYSVSIWGQQGWEQQQTNESNSVPLNYPIKSAFYLSAPTQPVQEESHTHTIYSFLYTLLIPPPYHLFLHVATFFSYLHARIHTYHLEVLPLCLWSVNGG